MNIPAPKLKHMVSAMPNSYTFEKITLKNILSQIKLYAIPQKPITDTVAGLSAELQIVISELAITALKEANANSI